MREGQPGIRWFKFGRILCKGFCRFFFRMRISGKENVPKEGGLLIICNHQSFLDPMLCGIYLPRPVTFLARDSLFKHWLFGRMISSVRTIPVRRGEADLSAMKTVISRLKEGGCVCLFPEGTRTLDGKIAPFKAGFGLLSRRGKAAIVPAVIDGAFECWPKSKKIFSFGSKIFVSYGKCISAEQARKVSDDELATMLNDSMRKMQNQSRSQQGKEPYDYR